MGSANLLAQRALLLARVESAFRVDEIDGDEVAAASDSAFLVGNPAFNPNITIVNRTNVVPDLSPVKGRVGRKIAEVTFEHEVRGDGSVLSSPLLGRLLRGCGFSETQLVGMDGIADSMTRVTGPGSGTPTFTKTTGYTELHRRVLRIEVTGTVLPGEVVVSVTEAARGPIPEVSQLGQTMTAGTPLSLTGGATITPSNVPTGLAIGDVFTLELQPLGWLYAPRSSNFDSLTIWLYLGSTGVTGKLHKLTGARGNVSMNAPGGDIARFSFTFQGDFNDVVDVVVPAAPNLSQIQPPIVEEADLFLADVNLDATQSTLCAESFSFDMQNQVAIRPCVNAKEAFEGAIITSRNTQGGMNPEVTLESDHPFWGRLSSGESVYFHARLGETSGNLVDIVGKNVTYTGLQYADRNGILVYDVGLQFARTQGDDELFLTFA